jgi:hypothetical protein
MDTRRSFVKKTAGTALLFGAGIVTAKAGQGIGVTGGLGCQPYEFTISGARYCQVLCFSGTACTMYCYTDAPNGGTNTTQYPVGPGNIPPSGIGPSSVITKKC